MQIQSINNQLSFNGLSIVPKGAIKSFSAENSPNLFKQLTDSMTKTDKAFFIKYIAIPLKNTKTDVRLDFNTNAISITPKNSSPIEMDTSKLAIVSNDDERVASYPLKFGTRYDLEFETTSDADTAVGYYNFRYQGLELIGKAYSAVSIAESLDKKLKN